MNFLEHPSEFWEERSNVQSHPLSLHFTQRAETLDENRLYRKHTGNTTGNGSFRGLSRKLQRQNSVNCPPVGVISYSEPSSSSVIDSEKSLRSNDRDWIESGGSGVEEVLEENDLSWVLKLKLYGIVCVSTLLILSAASFLFISILLVDPILVGLKASFQNEPGICRTFDSKTVIGPSNCSMPSCREGCTADIYVCTYVKVTYYETRLLNSSFVQSYYRHEIPNWNPDESLSALIPPSRLNSTNHSYSAQYPSAALMINPNGCGYPPDVNCSDFYDKFQSPGTLFPCFYSDSYRNDNLGVAVPFYDRAKEMFSLGLYCGIPLGAVLVLSLLLLILRNLKIGQRSRRRMASDLERVLTRAPLVKQDSLRLDSKMVMSNPGTEPLALSERLNGHGPKKKLLTPTPSWTSNGNEKTDKTLLLTREPVQRPSTSRNLPYPHTHH